MTEGGYDLPALGESLDAVVRVLAGEPAPDVHERCGVRRAAARPPWTPCAPPRRADGMHYNFSVADYNPRELDKKWQQRWVG